MIGYASARMVRGWAANSAGEAPVEVMLMINGEIAARKLAADWRPFAARQGKYGKGTCGFLFGEREILPRLQRGANQLRLFAVARDQSRTELQGSPLELMHPSSRPGINRDDIGQIDTEQTESSRVCHVINAPDLHADAKTVVVLGVSRGGTSMCAGLVRLLGIPMGTDLSDDSSEDPEFQLSDKRQLIAKIRRNNASHAVWGWKYPEAFRYLDKIRSTLRNPHFIVVTRDVTGVASSYRRQEGIALKSALAEANRRYAQLFRFIRKEQAPLLVMSYEKALMAREQAVRELGQFLGREATQAQAREYSEFIVDSGYNHFGRFTARLKDKAKKPLPPSQFILKGCLGEITADRIPGWAKFENVEKPACVDLYFNNQLVDSRMANEFRASLVKAGADDTGRCAFEFDSAKLNLPDRVVVGVRERETGRHLSGSPRLWRANASTESTTSLKPFVFIHVPKTCGTSFRVALAEKFGDRVVCDYTEREAETSPLVLSTLYGNAPYALADVLRDSGTLSYCGHIKYADYHKLLDGFTDRWVAILRDPVKRYISDYNHRVQRYGLDMPLETYLENPRLHNEQSSYLQGVSVQNLYFVGLSEYYPLSLELFAAETGIQLECLDKNRALPEQGGVAEVPSELLEQIKQANSQDMALYESAKAEFRKRLLKHGMQGDFGLDEA